MGEEPTDLDELLDGALENHNIRVARDVNNVFRKLGAAYDYRKHHDGPENLLEDMSDRTGIKLERLEDILERCSWDNEITVVELCAMADYLGVSVSIRIE